MTLDMKSQSNVLNLIHSILFESIDKVNDDISTLLSCSNHIFKMQTILPAYCFYEFK